MVQSPFQITAIKNLVQCNHIKKRLQTTWHHLFRANSGVTPWVCQIWNGFVATKEAMKRSCDTVVACGVCAALLSYKVHLIRILIQFTVDVLNVIK